MAESNVYERKEVHHSRDMGGDGWKAVVAELLEAELTRRRAAGSQERAIPVTFFMGANDEPDCVCTVFKDEDGEVCVCYGNCPDFPDCCDDAPVFTEG